jgi:hypothetical protein
MELITPSQTPKPRRRFRWKRWLLLAFCIAVVLAGLPFANEYYARWQARKDLEKAIAALDQSDPRWRLEDIEADRKMVPAEKNSAPIVMAAYQALPEDWTPKILDELRETFPQFALRPDQSDRLVTELQPMESALKKARELRDYPEGRYEITWSPDWISTKVEQFKAQKVGDLLDIDVALFLHRQEMEKAWQSNRAMQNAARSLGDEPLFLSMLSRIGLDQKVVRNLERILAQGELTAQQLATTQKDLEAEFTVPVFVIGMRGERAGIHRLLSKFETGEIPMLEHLAKGGKDIKIDLPWFAHMAEFFEFSMVFRSHVIFLDFETKIIEAGKLPLDKRFAALDKLEFQFRDRIAERHKVDPRGDRKQILARLLFPAFDKFARAEQKHLTQLSCAIAGVAAERFRLQHSRWPGSFEELVKTGFLKEVPKNLYDGQPLMFRRPDDGLVIYSKEYRLTYEGTALDKQEEGVFDFDFFDALSWRIEFRLWDVAHRRKTPPPKNVAP